MTEEMKKRLEEAAEKYADDVATTEERGWMDRSDIYAIAKDAHLAGVEWADAHPVSPWHKASEELPKEGQMVLISNPALQFAMFDDGLFKPVIRIGRGFEVADSRVFVDTEYWMYIPEIKEG